MRALAHEKRHYDVREVLTDAINRGLAFHIAVRLQDFPTFTPAFLTAADRHAARYYTPGFRDVGFSNEDNTNFASTYLGRMADLLSRPHARAFIGLGGPYSWLAKEFGEKDLVKAFMQGPSIQVTRHFKGAIDSEDEHFGGLHWDVVSATEQALLLGYVPAAGNMVERWLYPSPEILEGICAHWYGEWTVVMDRLFTFITAKVRKGVATPKSRTEWKGILRTWNHHAPADPISDSTFLDIANLLEEFGRTNRWHKASASALNLPEWRQIQGDD
ncbi:hypothetical protein CPC08DRAFT_652075 [Agrocybe pediades]|nr:hypothetical protein CPC08DRAFT_652075 [Agrocybe pediades]